MRKRIAAFLLSATMTCSLASNVVFAVDKESKTESRKIIDKMKENTPDKSMFDIQWDKKSKAPDFIKGELTQEGLFSNEQVQSFLEESKSLFNIQDGSFKVKKVEKDKLGKTHYRTKQVVDGIPVYGGELVVHTDINGKVYAVNGEVKPNIQSENWSSKVKLTAKDAIVSAEDFITEKANNYLKDPETELYLYEFGGKVQVVYLVKLEYIDPVWAKWRIFIDAENGQVVDSYDGATFAQTPKVGTGLTGLNQQVQINTVLENGKYYLIDASKPMSGRIKTLDMNYDRYYNAPGTLVSDTDNNFNAQQQKAAVAAHYYVGKVYDYYKNEYNRNSYDNNGANIISNVHCAGRYGERDWNNAAWIGDQFVYGDGDGSQFSNLSDAFDVVAHEFTHAVTSSSSNLEYRFQSGALNEALSDIIGVAVENVEGDWLIGEDCYTPGTPGDALRSMADPTISGQPAHMDDYKNYSIDYDNGGVHINNGIINKAAYNIGSVIGIYKMGQIFYRANTVYYTSTADFDDARTGAIQAASDLYGANSAEKTAVMNGFAAVGIGSAPPSGDAPFEPNDSFTEAHGSLESGNTYEAYLESSSDDDYYYIDVKAAGDITVSLTNLAGDYDVYLYNSSKTQVAKSTNGSTTNESINYSASAAGKYYIKVIGYSGAHSTTKAYRLATTFPTTAQEDTWHYVDKVMESAHNYGNNINTSESYSKPGAKKVAVHFVKLETESGYDFVYIKDKNGSKIKTYDGLKTDFWAVVEGDKITVNLVSDYSVNKYGYKIDRVAYFDSSASLTMNLVNDKSFVGITDETTGVESTFNIENRSPKEPKAPTSIEEKERKKKDQDGPINRPGGNNNPFR